MVGERKERLRKALADAAEAIVAERGLGALRARDLAQAAGCALGAIYTAYPDLDALALEVHRRTLALFEAHARDHADPVPASTPGEAVEALVRLSATYLGFAAANRSRWWALFEHRADDRRPLPDWYLAEQARLFQRVEAPLGALRPDLDERDRQLLARTLFSAVHGMVGLGLDEKIVTLPPSVLRDQVETVVRAMAEGLRARR